MKQKKKELHEHKINKTWVQASSLKIYKFANCMTIHIKREFIFKI